MTEIIIKTFWFFLPAGVANMAPVLFKWVAFLNYPVDFNLKFRNKNIFGKNKTYRGFFFGVTMSIFVVYLQKFFYLQTEAISIVNYSEINIVLLGFLFGFGALLGDLIESFFKRQVGILPGKTWPPFDQIDWIVGSLFLVSFYTSISWEYIMASIVIFGLLHPIINIIGYLLHIKKNVL